MSEETEGIVEGYQQLVMDNGDEVLIHTRTCMEWKLGHDNCKGCNSELGCAKTAAMLLVSMIPMMYKPSSYEDYETMQQSIQNKLENILKAKTSEEIHAISLV